MSSSPTPDLSAPPSPEEFAGGMGGGGRRTPQPIDEEPTPEPSRQFWLAVLGLALVLGTFSITQHWTPNKWLFGDGAFYMNVVRGVLENGSLRQESMHPHSWYDRDLGWNHTIDAAWSNIALGRNGEWWPKHPILMPLCALPFVWAFGPIGTLVFQFLMFGLMAVFAYRVASRVAGRPAALAAAAAFVATPWVFDRVWGFNNDVFYSVLILAAVDAALRGKAPLAGALLGIGVFAKATNVLYGPPLLLIFLLRKDLRGALRFCIAAAIPATLYLGLNWYMYGSPLRTGYDRILVRTAGQLGTHSHSADFHFSNLMPGLRGVLFGSEGFLGKYPLLFPAALGLLIMALRRRWREALVFAWCIAVPIAFHAPYAWYRLEFNLPQIALAVGPLAALLPPFSGATADTGTRSRVRWERILPIAALLLFVGAGLVRRALPDSHGYFWNQLPAAKVQLGDIPCDYFNNQLERWECSHYDNNDWYMTGRTLRPELAYGGVPHRLLVFHPHPSGRERTVEYADVPMTKTLELRYGLADSSRDGSQVHFKVLVDGQPLLEEDVRERGLVRKKLDTSAFAGRTVKVTFAVTSPDAHWCHFGFDGWLRSE